MHRPRTPVNNGVGESRNHLGVFSEVLMSSFVCRTRRTTPQSAIEGACGSDL
jgi:hypothetical protein